MEIVFVQMLMIGFSVDVPVCICVPFLLQVHHLV